MIAANGKIIVRSDLSQKNHFKIGEVECLSASLFNTNNREKQPVLAQVVYDSVDFTKGEILVLHHNTLYEPSPYKLYDDLFSIPANGKIIFGKLDLLGEFIPLFDNMIVDMVEIESKIPLPPSQIKKHLDRAIVRNGGYTQYKNGQMVFHRPSATYTIVYIVNGEEKKVTRLAEFQVCGHIKEI